ncbi:MAG: hypothetical protein ACT4QB_18920 [Gammaproteobacteria bacterium]
MMHFKFYPVELGAGWTSVEAWGFGGPIVLIEGRSATTGAIVKSRLDTQKQAFIDPNPFQADPETVRHLVESVTGAAETATPADP